MLVDFPTFVYNANPQSVYSKKRDNPFLQLREIGRAEYDFSSNAGNLLASVSGEIDLSPVDMNALLFFEISGDDDYELSSLLLVRAGHVKTNLRNGDGSVSASTSNSALVVQFLPRVIDQTPTADITALRYFFAEGANNNHLIVARSAVHSGRISVIGYEAH